MGLFMDEKVISKRMNFLRKVPLFAAFREEDLRELSEAFHARHYRKKSSSTKKMTLMILI